MTSQRELDSLLGAFFAEGPDQVADRVIGAALDQINQTKQRRTLRMSWRFQHMNSLSRVAVAAVIGLLVVGAGLYVTRPTQPPVGGPNPTPSASVSPSPTAEQPTPVPSGAALRAQFAYIVGDWRTGQQLWIANLENGGP